MLPLLATAALKTGRLIRVLVRLLDQYFRELGLTSSKAIAGRQVRASSALTLLRWGSHPVLPRTRIDRVQIYHICSVNFKRHDFEPKCRQHDLARARRVKRRTSGLAGLVQLAHKPLQQLHRHVAQYVQTADVQALDEPYDLLHSLFVPRRTRRVAGQEDIPADRIKARAIARPERVGR